MKRRKVKKRQKPSFYLERGTFDLLVRDFRDKGQEDDWAVRELLSNQTPAIAGHLSNPDTIAVFSSGSLGRFRREHGEEVVAGIDWVRHETSPKAGEPEVNVYHYVVTVPNAEHLFPVFEIHGGGGLAPHWCSLPDLGVYLDKLTE